MPFGYGLGAYGELLVGADDDTMTAVTGSSPAWTSDLPEGKRPGTLLDVDDRWVASITAVGQAEQGD